MAEKEYIEREAVLREEQEIYHWCGYEDKYGNFVSVEAIRSIPAADVAEVVHGEWTGCDGDNCSVCGRSPSEIMDADSYYAIGFNINDLVACPFCGAKMDERGDAE